jgi:hypothetical protein
MPKMMQSTMVTLKWLCTKCEGHMFPYFQQLLYVRWGESLFKGLINFQQFL